MIISSLFFVLFSRSLPRKKRFRFNSRRVVFHFWISVWFGVVVCLTKRINDTLVASLIHRIDKHLPLIHSVEITRYSAYKMCVMQMLFGLVHLSYAQFLNSISFRFISSSHHRFCVRLCSHLWEIVTSLSMSVTE